MKRRRLKYLLIFGVLGIAVAAQTTYWILTHKSSIRIASGPEYGQHRQMMEALQAEIEARTGLKVELIPSQGSLQNLKMLQDGDVHFALYQSGALRMKFGEENRAETDEVQFVCNLYPEVVHWIVHKDAGIDGPESLKGKRIAVGRPLAGDSAVSKILLAEHFGIKDGDYTAAELTYDEIRDQFEDGTLDVAFITVGTQAKIFEDLGKSKDLEFRSLKYIEALMEGHITLSPYKIRMGMYHSNKHVAPADDIDTVALNSQLLCRKDLRPSLVEQITEIALSEEFIRTKQLRELFDKGNEYAKAKPEFAMHPGAEHFYDPELKPILNSNFVEAMEGMRSFLVSLLIAGFVAWRSWKKWTEQQAEHRLDRYIRRLLEFERKQVSLGISPDALQKDEKSLRKLLDDVTDLRQDCLRDFTAHELNEDRSVDCFLEMCHGLSDKINAKLLRVHLDQRFEELATSLREKTGREAKLPAGE